jgi:Fe-S-cluster containining protein
LPRVLVSVTFGDIKFACQMCGSCCHHRRPLDFDDLVPLDRLKEFWEKSNLIYLTKKDIHDIAYRFGRKIDEFVDTLYGYDGNSVKVMDSGKKVILDLPVMKSKEDTTCVFYDKGCTMYSVRPKACRLFPFRVEEETTPSGDVMLNIGYNETCPGIGKGAFVDKDRLKKLVLDQFVVRTESVLPKIQKLVAEGKIDRSARIYRTLPGRIPPSKH